MSSNGSQTDQFEIRSPLRIVSLLWAETRSSAGPQDGLALRCSSVPEVCRPHECWVPQPPYLWVASGRLCGCPECAYSRPGRPEKTSHRWRPSAGCRPDCRPALSASIPLGCSTGLAGPDLNSHSRTTTRKFGAEMAAFLWTRPVFGWLTFMF